MLLCKHFVFIHFPRAGGTFVRETLARHIPPGRDVCILPGHGTVHQIPEAYRGVQRFGFVRNPWDWYVSVYSGWRGFSRARPEAFYGHVLGQISADPANTDFRTFLGALMKNHTWASQEIGCMSWIYMNMYGQALDSLSNDRNGLWIGKHENLREELMEFLRRVNFPASEGLEAAIGSDPPINGFERSPYAEYYDAELRDLVRERDRAIVDFYGYTFD